MELTTRAVALARRRRVTTVALGAVAAVAAVSAIAPVAVGSGRGGPPVASVPSDDSSPSSNIAQRRADAVVSGFGPVSPAMICDNGDDGLGIVNQTPWYTAYFTADGDRVDDVVVAAAAQAGWKLVRDEQALAVYPHMDPDGTVRGDVPFKGVGPLAGVPFGESTTYLADRRDSDRLLVVDVVRSGPVRLFCGGTKEYGRQTSPADGRVIIVLSMTAARILTAPS
ncbi:hypothetical protein ACFQY4_20480 [Catellatospora bangladeshensis]|uniref:hypothetical protein n=1 Tax=Catellatospora bangladeshensis TaxID=310355 RepID=UPI003617C8D6